MNVHPIKLHLAAAEATLDQLLLREAVHRFGNDMQMIVSLILLESKRTSNPETKEALRSVGDRVALFARKRMSFGMAEESSLSHALQNCCQTLIVQAEARSVLISFRMHGDDPKLDADTVRAVALSVNELATNALKHAFTWRPSGRIWIEYQLDGDGMLIVTVDDDGAPISDPTDGREHNGHKFITQLIKSVGGTLTLPRDGSKQFAIKISCKPDNEHERLRRSTRLDFHDNQQPYC